MRSLLIALMVAGCAPPQSEVSTPDAFVDPGPPQFPCVPNGGDGCAAAKIYAQAKCFHNNICGAHVEAQQCAVDIVTAYCKLTDCSAPYAGDFTKLEACANAIGAAVCPDLGPTCLVTP